MSIKRQTSRKSINAISFAATTALLLGSGCAAVSESDQVDERTTIGEFSGNQDVKADGSAATQQWAVYEQAGNEGLVARDGVGQVLLDAQIVEVEGSSVTVSFRSPAECRVQFDVASGTLLATDCSVAAATVSRCQKHLLRIKFA